MEVHKKLEGFDLGKKRTIKELKKDYKKYLDRYLETYGKKKFRDDYEDALILSVEEVVTIYKSINSKDKGIPAEEVYRNLGI